MGRGARRVAFTSDRPARPAQFYLLSYPAHASYPTRLVRFADTAGTALGSATERTSRSLHKFIHPGGVKSCQLVLGLTVIAPGSAWNTMPPHTHIRRSEVYLYFGLPARGRVTHFMGNPDCIRRLTVRDREADKVAALDGGGESVEPLAPRGGVRGGHQDRPTSSSGRCCWSLAPSGSSCA